MASKKTYKGNTAGGVVIFEGNKNRGVRAMSNNPSVKRLKKTMMKRK